MAKMTFKTLPDHLVENGHTCVASFRERGFRVSIEKKGLGYPYTPTFVGKRDQTEIFFEVMSKIGLKRAQGWQGYARSCSKDTRIALCIPAPGEISHEDENVLRDLGVGLYVVKDDSIVERLPPKDQALNLILPPLKEEPRPVRKVLGAVYEQFERSQWREGFDDACKVVEVEARNYLKKGIKSGRITVLDKKGKPRKLSASAINKMTLGQLEVAFTNIQNQNYADSQIGQGLQQLREDRNSVTHHKRDARTERRLRRNVGQHMWVVLEVLKYALGVARAK